MSALKQCPHFEQCDVAREAYQRGREEERADVVAYLREYKSHETGYGMYYAGRIKDGEHEVKR